MTAVALWVRAEWRRSLGSLVALAALLALSGGVVLALAAGTRRADTSLDRFAKAVGMPDITLSAPVQDAAPNIEAFNEHLPLVHQAAAIDGVASTSVEAWYALIDENEVQPGKLVEPFIMGLSALSEDAPTPVRVLRGQWPGPTEDAVVVNETAEREGHVVGSTITFRSVPPSGFEPWAEADANLPDDSLLTGPTITVRVAAVIRQFEEIGHDQQPFVAITPGFEAHHAADVAHCDCFVRARTDGSRPIAEVEHDLVALYAPYHMEPVPPDPGIEPARLAIEVEVTTLRIATVVAALAALLLVGQAFGRTIGRIGSIHGVRRSLGMTTGQLVLGALASVAPALVAGLLGAIGVAIVLSGLFPVGLAKLAEIDPGLRVDPRLFSVYGPLLLLTGLALCALLSWRAAVGRRGVAPGASRSLSRWFHRPAPALGASFALDPLGGGTRSRVVAATTAASVALAVGAALTVVTVASSTDHLQDTPGVFGASGEFAFLSNGQTGVDDALAAAKAQPAVHTITEYIAADTDTTGELTVDHAGRSTAVQPAVYRSEGGAGLPALMSGALPDSRDEVAIGRRTAQDLHAHVGDHIDLETDDGRTLPLVVTGTVVAWGEDTSENAFVVTRDTLEDAVCSADSCDLERNVFASTDDADAQAALLDAGFRKTPPPANVGRLDQVGAIPWYLAGFLGVLGLAGIGHALASSLRRRGSDLAIVRALGLTGRRAARSLSWQAGIAASLGLVAGIVLGLVVGRAIWSVIADSLGVLYEPILPLVALPLVAAGAVGGSLVLATVPAARARRLRPAEQLHAE